MRAARYYGKGDIRVEEVDEPKLLPGKCIVDIEWCGICGSDLHDFIQGPTCAGGPPHVLTGETIPLALGHEMCGRVRNPSPQSDFKDGDPVMIDPRILCRDCNYCASGHDHGCEKLGYMGSNTGGGFAERCAVDEQMLYKLPESVPLEYAAIIEPLAVVHHAIKMAGLSDWNEKHILVVGGGPIGLALIIALKAHGAERIIVSEPTAARREQVIEFVGRAINPLQEDVVDTCKKLTSGQGVDIVFDCAGVPIGLETGMKALKLEGIYMNLAIWEKPMVIPIWTFMKRHIVVKSALVFNDEDFREILAMVAAGKFIGYEKLVTSRVALEHIVDQGFEELVRHKDKHVKILVSNKVKP